MKELVVIQELTNRDLAFYAFRILLDIALLLVGTVSFGVLGNSWLQLLTAAYLAFVFTQLGFIVHDSGHQQIFKDERLNKIINLIFANVLLGCSSAWWITTHNRHHGNPNQCGLDPDIEFVALAFSEEQAMQKRGIFKFIARNQAFLFFPLLLLESFSLRAESLRFLARNSVRFRLTEWCCIIANYVLCLGAIFYRLDLIKAVVFVVLNQALFGAFLGLIFVTNHKGMPLLEKGARMDFLERQVATTRNIRRSWAIDYFFGGLSCQIEHHLFPNIPVGKLRKAQNIVKPYCHSIGVSYHEVGLLESYREVVRHLRELGASVPRSQ